MFKKLTKIHFNFFRPTILRAFVIRETLPRIDFAIAFTILPIIDDTVLRVPSESATLTFPPPSNRTRLSGSELVHEGLPALLLKLDFGGYPESARHRSRHRSTRATSTLSGSFLRDKTISFESESRVIVASKTVRFELRGASLKPPESAEL